MKTLIIVDVQYDFCLDGSLAVKGDFANLFDTINKLSNLKTFDLVAATQDWHPSNHISFASTHAAKPFEYCEKADQVVWPDHCIQGTRGSKLHIALDQNPINFIVRKGMKIEADSYSAFIDADGVETGLHKLLDIGNEGSEIYICGIAADVCVYFTALDALKYTNKVTVVQNACIGTSAEATNKAFKDLQEKGIMFI